MPLAGPPTCGSVFPYASGPCRDAGDSAPLLVNARWVPYVIGRGALDELVPVAGVAAQDRFDAMVEALPSSPRRRDPGHVTYSWYPDLTPAGDGIGATGAYWPGTCGRGVPAPASCPRWTPDRSRTPTPA
jgi:hypothetical protein